MGRPLHLAWAGALLIGLIALTYGAAEWHGHWLRRAPLKAQQDAIDRAERRIAARFDAMQETMERRAQALASDSLLISALKSRSDTVIRFVAARQFPPPWSMAVHDQDGSLKTWTGVTIPLGAVAPFNARTLRWGLASDGDWRHALELWHPILDGDELLGHLRLLRLLYERRTVQNEYLQDYRVEEEWSRLARLPVSTFFGPQESPANARVLAARDGATIGYYALRAPALEQLASNTKRFYFSIIAVWVVLLLAVALRVIWLRYRADRSWHWLAATGLALWGVRFVLLWADVPERWQMGKAPLSPLFDATHLATPLGGGLMRSTGDFLVSAIFLFFFALLLLRHAHHRYGAVSPAAWQLLWYSPRHAVRGFAAALLGVGLIVLMGVVARRAVVDSTVSYLSRDALLPDALILVIFCALAICTLAIVIMMAALIRMALGAVSAAHPGKGGHRVPYWAVALILLLMVITAAHVRLGLPWTIVMAFLLVAGAAVHMDIGANLQWLSMRGVLLATLIVSTLMYPLILVGLNERRVVRMEHAATSFDRGFDASVAFAVRDLLEETRKDPALAAAFRSRDFTALERIADTHSEGALLASRGAYDVAVHFLDTDQMRLGGSDSDSISARSEALLDRAASSNVIVRAAAGIESGQAYEGIASVGADGTLLGWIMVRAEPQVLPEGADTPLLRILLPSGYRDLYANLSIGSFRDGILQRSIGRSFRHYALDADVVRALQDTSAVWRLDAYGSRRYEAHYRRQQDGQIVGVRARSIALFDHLYYLLRLIVAGLLVGAPFYLVGLVLRRRVGMLPAKHVRFQDKMLNAFLVMAIIAVIPVGIVGVRVVTEENTKAIQSWLRNHLHLVEIALASEAQGDELPYAALARVSIDSLAARVGLDLNLYEGRELIASSRPELVRERLTDTRMPLQAYEALFVDGYKFAPVAQQLGHFGYTAGYHALLDEAGVPRFVLSVPTLPEQERIDEERARTLAYLFGALLALMILVMVTASVMASALARPIARLQQGLRAVARGRFERRIAIHSRDEVGQLAQTFNEMQNQLAESRRQLTQQERQLAWREMARQVAHEIKNPLTPMKLSLQHLQRAFAMRRRGDVKRFRELFARVTSTLIREIDSLAHIANEFASFARMPDRMVEHLDLVDVMREAAALMQAEANDGITFDLQFPEASLVVRADRKELKRIYVNLLKNALEAMHEDPEGVITMEARRDADTVYSAVRDTGCGIAPDLREKIFEPSFSTKSSGAGLGLAIARQSIEASGGTIGFRTSETSGTGFYIRLPLAN